MIPIRINDLVILGVLLSHLRVKHHLFAIRILRFREYIGMIIVVNWGLLDAVSKRNEEEEEEEEEMVVVVVMVNYKWKSQS